MNKKDKKFNQDITLSIIAILLCLLFLCGTTFAWITDSSKSGELSIKAASFSMDVTVYEIISPNEKNEVNANADGRYTLEKGKSYDITLTAHGDATTGFCKISYEEDLGGALFFDSIYTSQIAQGTSFNFTLCNDKNIDIIAKFIAVWGTSAHTGDDVVESNGSIFVLDDET